MAGAICSAAQPRSAGTANWRKSQGNKQAEAALNPHICYSHNLIIQRKPAPLTECIPISGCQARLQSDVCINARYLSAPAFSSTPNVARCPAGGDWQEAPSAGVSRQGNSYQAARGVSVILMSAARPQTPAIPGGIHETLNQRRFNVGPASATVAQH